MYLHAIRVKFVYEGHWIKVKVTGPKKRCTTGSHTTDASVSEQVRFRARSIFHHQ